MSADQDAELMGAAVVAAILNDDYDAAIELVGAASRSELSDTVLHLAMWSAGSIKELCAGSTVTPAQAWADHLLREAHR